MDATIGEQGNENVLRLELSASSKNNNNNFENVCALNVVELACGGT